LKPIRPFTLSLKRSLSALDPGKQGLKHPEWAALPFDEAIFQRLIQENKD